MSEQQRRPDNQIAKLVSVLVEHQRHFGAMSTAERQFVIQHTAKAIKLFIAAVRNEQERKLAAELNAARMDTERREQCIRKIAQLKG